MSTLNLKNIQLGDNPDPSKNFVLSVPAVADGTLSIKRANGTNVLSIDAAGKAVIPGVVGTVAQVGGIPTGQIVERGSNTNGGYVRFADGMQICLRSAIVSSAEANQTPFAGVWTFPAAFSGNPVLSGSAHVNDNVDGYFLHISFRQNSSTSIRVVAQKATTTGGSVFVAATAIGRWF